MSGGSTGERPFSDIITSVRYWIIHSITIPTLFLSGFSLPVLANTKKKKNLVIIMLRGGMDGLCAVPVIGDRDFEKRRKDLILDKTIKLNTDFALHPKLKNFHSLS